MKKELIKLFIVSGLTIISGVLIALLIIHL
jgi:hypothetical protein